MVIDFHTHVFPRSIAEKTVKHLSVKGGIPPFSDGTEEGLLDKMKESGVDLSVNLPVMTSPAQFESVKRFALDINERFYRGNGKILSFGGIHPASDGIEGKIKELRDAGFLGVKIHPDYQETYIDDEAYVRIVRAAMENDMIVITHAGFDCGYPDSPIRCTPERVLRLLEKAPHKKLVLAHLGGINMTDEVIELLAGRDIYLDTAYLLRFVEHDKLLKLIEKHGEDKILFASDSPWSDAGCDLSIIKSLGMKEEGLNKILYKNASALLKL